MRPESYADVKELAKKGDYRLIPLIRELMADIATPVQVMRKLKNVSDHCFLLESVEDSRQWGRYSFLGYEPKVQITLKDHVLTVTSENGETKQMQTDEPGAFISSLVSENKSPRIEGLPTFTGGLVGYFSYDYMQYPEPSLHFKAKNDYDFSDMDLMLFENLIVFDNLRQKIMLIANVHVPFAKNADTGAENKN